MHGNNDLKICLAFIIILGLACAMPAYAQLGPDAPLLLHAKQALEQKDTAKAIECLNTLLEKYPDTGAAAEGTVIWYKLALDAADTQQAETLWKDALTHWPQTDYIWLMMEASCNHTARLDPEKALADLERMVKDDAFPPLAKTPAQRLRFTLLEKSNPALFLDEGMALMGQMATCETAEELDLLRGISGRLYRHLMREKRYEDATSLAERMQEKIALMGNPHNWLGEDTVAYFEALAAADPERYLVDVRPMILAAQWAETTAEAELSVQLARRAYTLFFSQGKIAEVEKIHADLQQALQTADLTDLAGNDAQVYHYARLKILRETDPKLFLSDALPFIKTAGDVRASSELLQQAEIARLSFSPLMRAGRVEEAREAYRYIIAVLERNNVGSREVHQWFFDALKTQPAHVFLTEAVPLLDFAKTAQTEAEFAPAMSILRFAYPHFLSTGRLADAQAYHAALQAQIMKLGNPNGWAAQEQQCYLEALLKVNAAFMVAEIQPLLDNQTAPATPAEALERAALARGAYKPLMTAGKLDEAKMLHDRVQQWLATAEKAEEAQADAEAFRQSISKEAMEAMFTLFKRALAANDLDGARKWLTNLNMIAPEHPRAMQARKIFKDFEESMR